MTTLINARPRFGLEGDRLFCYLTSRYYDISDGLLEDGNGVWDLAKVAELIRGGSTIETAFTSGPQPDSQDTPQPDKVEQFVRDFNAATPEPAAGDKVEQAKQDFMTATDFGGPDGDHGVTVTAEKQADGSVKILDVQTEPRADVEGAMAAQEAPPKGE